jgi:FkbM family methyltransferase
MTCAGTGRGVYPRYDRFPMGTRAAAYIREFSPGRDDAVPAPAELSAAEQRERLEQYIADQGWDRAHVYEEGAPNPVPRWPALQSALNDLADFDKLVVTSFDRLPHSARRMANILRRLERNNVELVSVEEQFDTADDRGDAVRKVLDTIARWDPVDARAGNGWSPGNLRKPGLRPSTLIDVGVAAGTFGLHEAFRDAHHVFIEPLVDFRDELTQLAKTYGGEYVATAVGAEEGTTTLRVHHSLGMSSILTSLQAEEDVDVREVPITTLDKLVARHGWTPPFGLKLDVEGYEPFVVKGASQMLKDTQFVIAELGVRKRFEGDLACWEFIELMRTHGFEVADVIDSTRVYVDVRFQRSAELKP